MYFASHYAGSTPYLTSFRNPASMTGFSACLILNFKLKVLLTLMLTMRITVLILHLTLQSTWVNNWLFCQKVKSSFSLWLSVNRPLDLQASGIALGANEGLASSFRREGEGEGGGESSNIPLEDMAAPELRR